MVDGAALVVPAVREHLDGELALEQLDAAFEHRRRAEGRAAEHERTGVADHVVAEHVVLDVPRQHDQLPPEALAHGRRLELRQERERGDPVAGSGRDRVRMPRIPGARRVAARSRPPGAAAAAGASPARAAASTSSPYCAWKPRSRSEPAPASGCGSNAGERQSSAGPSSGRKGGGVPAPSCRRRSGRSARARSCRGCAVRSACRSSDGFTRPPPRRRRRAPSRPTSGASCSRAASLAWAPRCARQPASASSSSSTSRSRATSPGGRGRRHVDEPADPSPPPAGRRAPYAIASRATTP